MASACQSSRRCTPGQLGRRASATTSSTHRRPTTSTRCGICIDMHHCGTGDPPVSAAPNTGGSPVPPTEVPVKQCVPALALLMLSVASQAADPKPAHTDHKSEHGAVSLDVSADGDRVHLLLGTRDAGRAPELTYLTSRDGGETWSDAVPVGANQPAPEPAHRGMDAQIAAAGDRLVVVWTTEGKEDRFGRGPMASAYSADGGKTWSVGANPADDGTAIGHAFIDVAADDQGVFHLVWLDGRDAPVSPAAIVNSATTRPASAGKGLRYARSTDGG